MQNIIKEEGVLKELLYKNHFYLFFRVLFHLILWRLYGDTFYIALATCVGLCNVTVMAPLSVYLVSEPLGLTLESQCALETVKMDLLFEELLFVQNS